MRWENAFWMVACLLFASLPRGQLDTTCHAFVGETVILPCTITSPGELDVSDSKLYWQIESILVHFFHNGEDSLRYQDENYRGRTSLFLDEVKHGNFSLQLSNIRLEDAAVYTCIYKQARALSNKTQKSKIKLDVSDNSQASPRSPGDAQGLDILALSFHLLVTLVVWHL